jgi:hypothetical protein
MDCYVAVYSEGQIEQGIYDTLFLEARDTDNLQQVIMDRDMIRTVLDDLKIGYRCFYSGGRSYHFYLDFQPIPVNNLSSMSRNLVQDLDIGDLLDMHTVGNRRSVGRIPYTYNTKSDKYAVYTMTDDVAELDYISANGIIEMPPITELQPTSILQYLKPNDDFTEELIKPADVAFDGFYPDCILNIITKLRLQKHATHAERIHLAASLYKMGKSFEEIEDMFKMASDYNPVVTETQLRSIIGSNYRPFSCGRVKKEMDVCPYRNDGRYCHFIQKLMKKADSTK